MSVMMDDDDEESELATTNEAPVLDESGDKVRGIIEQYQLPISHELTMKDHRRV
jgi:hypothetical protein